MRRPRGSLTLAQQELAASCYPLAYGLALRTIKNYPYLGDDVISEAMIALVRAARAYDKNHGEKFTSYVTRVIQSHLGHLIRGSQKRRLRLNDRTEQIGIDDVLSEMIEVPERRTYQQVIDDNDELQHVLTLLTPETLDVARQVYLDGVSQRKFAKQRGIDPEYLRIRVRRNFVAVREAMAVG